MVPIHRLPFGLVQFGWKDETGLVLVGLRKISNSLVEVGLPCLFVRVWSKYGLVIKPFSGLVTRMRYLLHFGIIGHIYA